MEGSNSAAQTEVWSWKQKVHLGLTDLEVVGKMSFYLFYRTRIYV